MKKILFFAAMFVAVVCSTALMSCSSDDDDDVKKPVPVPEFEFYYDITVELQNDVLSLYNDVTITYEFADGEVITESVTQATNKLKHHPQKSGRVKISINGKLNTSAVDESKSYSIGVGYSVNTIGNSEEYFEKSEPTGKEVLEYVKNLKDLPCMSRTFNI